MPPRQGPGTALALALTNSVASDTSAVEDTVTAELTRSITIDGDELEFSNVFEDLHVLVYQEVLAGRGFGIEDTRGAIQLVHDIRHASAASPSGVGHPWLVHGPG